MSSSGVVKFFNDSKGFGFITPHDGGGADIFVHRTEVNGDPLQEGDEVCFDMGQDDRSGKPKAFNVTGGTGQDTGGFGGGKGGGKGKGGKGKSKGGGGFDGGKGFGGG
eukprot:CAMPEP_0179292052 /NCGR_PEP_ID=MMETSP0797-20121207/42657_1 /TAXON_ID=47934 /ORGANISM="Dinophysis acuminata, Strain DAEP01" /LENGTH=107 /DNA_ID=CAMNT_0021001153 /DNA_START=23 /DNA_END=343 /DNA_ORIENTATION=+